MSEDTLFAPKLDYIIDFEFNAQVADVFDDMIERSVPAYRTLIALTGLAAARYYQDSTFCYDLGCSLGASSIAFANRMGGRSFNIIGVDNSKAMLDKCRANITKLGLDNQVELREQDLADLSGVLIENASVVIMNFTLQFIAPELRAGLIQKIAQGLAPGGILLLAEKISNPDTEENQWIDDMHYWFKRNNGYSELEVSQKRTALEKVLLAESAQQHMQRLQDCGFSRSGQWFQCLNFSAFYAIK